MIKHLQLVRFKRAEMLLTILITDLTSGRNLQCQLKERDDYDQNYRETQKFTYNAQEKLVCEHF